MPRPGPRRKPINVRVDDNERAELQDRADREADGNLSEFARRGLGYSRLHMPTGWTPEQATEEEVSTP